MLVIFGPGEFWADAGHAPLTENELARSLIGPELFLHAYDRFMAQGIHVSPAAQKWLGERAAALPPNYILMRDAPASRVIPVGGRRVGVVWFAPGAAPGGEAQNGQAQSAALKAGRALRGEVDLLIGVSPWGSEAERSFAARAEGVYHIILGGGPGYGFGSALKGANNGVLWLRPEPLGSAVNLLEILAWPEQPLHRWESQANFKAGLELLGPSVPSDPALEEMFSK